MNKKIVCILNCGSLDAMRQAEQMALVETDPDRVIVDICIAFPGGVEQRTEEHYRVGDYYPKRIQVIAQPETTSLMLVFEPDMLKPGRRFWKDMIVEISTSIRNAIPGVSMESMEAVE